MFDNIKKRKFLAKILSLKRFCFVFTLRQGTILIAVHQIALSALFLILLFTGLTNLGTMMSLLHSDMEDDEIREYYRKILQGEESVFANGEQQIHSLNAKMFNIAEHLASEIVLLIYSSTVITGFYFVISIFLLYGAIKYKRSYIMPWIVTSIIGLFVTALLLSLGGMLTDIVKSYGGEKFYFLFCVTSLAMSVYAILTVSSFVAQMDKLRPQVCGSVSKQERNIKTVRPRNRPRQKKYELGERMVLIDHAAQSSVLSTTQLNKLSSGMQTHFV